MSVRLAERVGFEPTVTASATTVFETASLNRSGTSPHAANETGALGGNRTPYALLRTEALYPMSYEGTQKEMARLKGFEPPT